MRAKAYSYLRMSTEQQLKGDSLRRQKEASRKYAEKHDLLLVDSLEDIGVSAYKGKNRTDGALGHFFELVETGRVERGSYLILESLDRLSREQAWHALPHLVSLVRAGIKVVTLCDGKVYDENAGEMDLMYGLVIMSRSHDESRMKSQRAKASWENKRRRMHESPMTATCPGWLRLNKARNAFEVIPERAAVVRRIFDESLAGLGRNTIAKGLNRDGVLPFSSRGRGWHPGTVQKIRHNPAVIGYLPVKGDRKSGISEDRAGYYPPVIPPEIFYRVQALVEGRHQKGGRRGARFANLFQHLCFCGVCGEIMTVISKGPVAEKYYACDNHRRGFGCAHATSHKIRWLENAVFNDVFSSVDYSRFDQGQDALTKAEGERAALLARLEEKRGRANLLLERFGVDSDVEIIAQHVKKLDGEIKALESKLLQADQALIRLRHDSLSLRRRVEILRELAASLETAAEAEVYRIRSAINQQLRAAIERVLFFPNRSVQVQLPGEYQQMVVMPSGVRLWAHCL